MVQASQPNPNTKLIYDECQQQLPQINLQEINPKESSEFFDSEVATTEESSSEVSEEEILEEEMSHQVLMTQQMDSTSKHEEQEEMESFTILQQQPEATEIKGFTFTLNDIPPPKWGERMLEFKSWLLLKEQKPGSNVRQILSRLVLRFTGILHDWWGNLREYRQLQFLQTLSVEQALIHVYQEFYGQDGQTVEKMRAECFKMKCCSMSKKDLENHYNQITKRFYPIGGIDDPNLKQAFLSSIPDPLRKEATRLLNASGLTLQNTTLEELYQLIIRALDKMCSQNKILHEYLK